MSSTESGTNILGLVVFSTVLGITLGKMGESGKPLLSFFETLSTAMMIITNWVVWYVNNFKMLIRRHKIWNNKKICTYNTIT